MNRNRLKSEQGELWLIVPVWKKGRGKQSIQDVEICDESNWRRRHLRGIRHMYANAPYRDDYLPEIESIYARNHQHLVDLNLDLIRLLWDGLGLNSRLVPQSELGISCKGSELLASSCHALNADTYATLPIVEKYLDAEIFRANNIRLDFTRFSPPIYPQL